MKRLSRESAAELTLIASRAPDGWALMKKWSVVEGLAVKETQTAPLYIRR